MARGVAGTLLFVILSAVAAEQFLGVSTIEQRRAFLLKELRASLQGGRRRIPTEERLAQLEDSLRPTFAALPKVRGGGSIGATSTRYALHRLFLQLHGWQIKGLEAAGEPWNELSLDDNVGRLMPERLRDLFDERLDRGVDLHELAALAAAIEALIHRESEARLTVVGELLNIPMTGATLNLQLADELLDSYMMTFIRGIPVHEITLDMLHESTVRDHVRDFLRDVRATALPGKTGNFSFEDVEGVAEEVGERYGRWQDFECGDMRNDLLKLEDHKGSGLVRLSDFYSFTVLNGSYFDETRDYLREHGTLDEVDPSNPRVIISNYITAPSNCQCAMTYYSVCCLNRCEDILADFELQLATPSASPAALLRLASVAVTPFSGSNRTFPVDLVERLHDVADFHGGLIPLHGRLFAQWMHHAFPRDCPYPHPAGTTKPRRKKEYMEQTGLHATLTLDQMRQYLEEAPKAPQAATASPPARPWVAEEELVDPAAHHRSGSLRGGIRVLMQALTLASVMLAAWTAAKVAAPPQHSSFVKPRGPKVHEV